MASIGYGALLVTTYLQVTSPNSLFPDLFQIDRLLFSAEKPVSRIEQLLEASGNEIGSTMRPAFTDHIFKLDIALEGGIPWRAAELNDAGTVHLGGTFEEIARGEAAVFRGEDPERPFVLLAQPSRFDPSRAPEGRETVWAYCHVPNGSTTDMTEPIVSQIERFAPGFRERILALTATDSAALEAYNPNCVGGDVAGGRMDLGQLFTRPTRRAWDPYSTPDPGIFLCSASTPPGGGVHGMSGLHAARSASRRLR